MLQHKPSWHHVAEQNRVQNQVRLTSSRPTGISRLTLRGPQHNPKIGSVEQRLQLYLVTGTCWRTWAPRFVFRDAEHIERDRLGRRSGSETRPARSPRSLTSRAALAPRSNVNRAEAAPAKRKRCPHASRRWSTCSNLYAGIRRRADANSGSNGR